MSWLFSQALVAEFSAGTCSDGEPSAQLNVMPTQHPFWLKDKTTEPSRLSRFGQTSNTLTEDRGRDLLTWFREASLARTSARQEKAAASKAPDPASGDTWPESSGSGGNSMAPAWRAGMSGLTSLWARQPACERTHPVRPPKARLIPSGSDEQKKDFP
jgi:hypothetical protein